MSLTVDLKGSQLLQLNALLADTTPGGGVYRPAVARDAGVLHDLEQFQLVRWTKDCGYEITDAGLAVVVDHAMDEAASEGFVRCASRHELRESIERLKAVFNDLTDPVLRERTLVNIEACQDRLEDLDEGRSESTGRHRVVPADDRPTETLARVELPTEPLPHSGTLPAIPVAEILTDREGAERLLAAIQDQPSPDDVAEYLTEPHTAEEWAALEADLADDPWWRRKLTPARTLVLSVTASVVVTWFVAWLVMA